MKASSSASVAPTRLHLLWQPHHNSSKCVNRLVGRCTKRSSALSASMRSPLKVLEEYWGYSSFRDPQASVISNALAGNDSLVVMATGGGKSICYQVPPLVSGRPCVVVSPLIALMEDQVAALTARGIKAAMLGSAQTKQEVKRKAWAGEYDLIYITPELATNNTAALQQLHSVRPIGLIAIDEAHCLSEWGHDFRPSYRQLGVLRDVLPGVPIMAVTATATQRVQQDIIKQLCMDQPSSPPFRQWVMSFQRHNLHLSVQLKAGGGAAGNLAHLVTEALQGNSPGPTLIYAQTTNEVDTLAAHLQAKGIKAVKYHAKLPLSERVAAHRDFQRDDASVMVASLAFGMGIDKPNIRRIIHYGIPSSLESYYQQAGRAGRDGLPAECSLLWSAQDFVMQDMIKGAAGLTGWNLESHTRGMEALRCYTSTGDCRHAALVNFFQPGALNTNGPCEGGCDNCKRRQSAAPGAPAGTDITQPSRLLLAAVKGLRSFGLNRAVMLLKGSKSKQVDPWMQELVGPDGVKLHGAGSNRSEDWWKGLGNVLVGQGYLASKTKAGASGNFSITIATPKGCQWLASPNPAALLVMLPSHMEEEETRQRRRQAAEAQRAAERQAVQQKRDAETGEKQQLLVALRAARKAKADELGQAPDVLVNDATLQLLIELRPSSLQDLSAVSGFGTAALQHFGQPLLAVIQEFCSTSQHLKHNTDWVQVKRLRTAAQAGQQQQFQQHLQQFKMTQQQPTAAGLTQAPSQAALQASPWVSRAGSGAAAGAAAAAGGDAAMTQQQDDPQQQLGKSSHLTADSEVYQGLLDAKVLSEPKKAAQAAWEQWQQGRSIQQIAQERDKPIQDSTVLGYLADAAAYYGCTTHKVQQLQAEGALGGDAAGDALLWRLVTAINANKGCALSFLKSNLPAEVTYGQIKVAAALLALRAIPGAAAGSEAQQEPQLPLPATPPVLGAELERLLQAPGSNAKELYGLLEEGVPLEALGTMLGGNMPMQTVLGYLADMAAAGYPTNMQQLAAAALLHQDTAQAVAAAIRKHGPKGLHSVRQALQQQLGDVSPGQVKVVAALMATSTLWFSSPAAGAAAGEAPAATAAAAAAGPAMQAAAASTGGGPGTGLQSVQAAHEVVAAAGAAAAATGVGHFGGQLGLGGAAAEWQSGSVPAVQTAAAGAAAVAADTAVCVKAQALQSAAVDDTAAAAASICDPPPAAAAVAAGDGAGLQPGLAPKRKVPGSLLLANKNGKRRRPTSIAAPPAAQRLPTTPQQTASATAEGNAAAATLPVASGGRPTSAVQGTPLQRCLMSPVTPAAGIGVSAALAVEAAAAEEAAGGAAGHQAGVPAAATPAGSACITQEAVLQLLWKATCTAPELMQKLGATTPHQAQQLQQVLEHLVEAGDQVCATPQCSRVDVRNTNIRFIAF